MLLLQKEKITKIRFINELLLYKSNMKKSRKKFCNKISNYLNNNSLADIIKIIKKFNKKQIFLLSNFVGIPIYLAIIIILFPEIAELNKWPNYSFCLILLFLLLLYGFLFFIFFRYHLIKHKKDKKEKWNILQTIALLLSNRITKNDIIFNLISMIFLFYFSIIYLVWIMKYQILEFFSSFIFLGLLLTFAFNAIWLLNVIVGIQDDGKRTTIWFVITIFISFGWFYFIILYNKLKAFLPIISTNISSIQILQWAISVSLPIIVTIIIWRFSKKKVNLFLKEKHYSKKSWNKIFISKRKDILGNSTLIFLFIFLTFFPSLLILAENFNVLITFGDLFNLFIFQVILTFPLIFFFMSEFVREIVYNLFNWHLFFNIKYGTSNNNLNELNKLVKISGKCYAISCKNEFKEMMYDDFDQQFLLTVDECKQNIQVVRLLEKTPFFDSKNIVKENDEIFLIGEIRKIYEGWIKQEEENIFIAYHIFSNKDQEE